MKSFTIGNAKYRPLEYIAGGQQWERTEYQYQDGLGTDSRVWVKTRGLTRLKLTEAFKRLDLNKTKDIEKCKS